MGDRMPRRGHPPDEAVGMGRSVAMPTSRLRVRVGRSERWLGSGEVAVIGRDDAVEIRLASEGVSRRHARLYHGPKGWMLEDLGSTNGTWLEGARVTSMVVDRPLTVELGPAGLPCRLDLEPVTYDADRRRGGRWTASHRFGALSRGLGGSRRLRSWFPRR
jgi:hypothetical protein